MTLSVKPSLSLESYAKEEEKETLARRYRSVSRNLIHQPLMFQLQVNWLNTRDRTLFQADSNPKPTLETVFC